MNYELAWGDMSLNKKEPRKTVTLICIVLSYELYNSLRHHCRYTLAPLTLRRSSVAMCLMNYTIPCAIIALATFMKPAMFAPFT